MSTTGKYFSWIGQNVIGVQSSCTWSNVEIYTLTQMQTLNSGLLTLLNQGDGAGLWLQSTSVNNGLPYLKNNVP